MSGRITVPAASVIPQGVGAPPPPGLDPKKGKLMCIKVRMLDDTVGVFHLGHKALGQALFEEVCRHLNLLECDYFGLEFLDSVGNRCWLDKDKSILRQITAARSDARFYFVVKFYPPNPADLEEEYTRYLFALQVKRDLASGQFVVNENTAALMASYIVQSECGDFCADDYPDHTYLSSVRFIPNQSAEFEKKVMDNHKKIIGTSPAESDLALLETARRVEFYGVKFHPAKDIEGTAVNLTVLHLGLKVYHQLSCANTFSWAKIRKLSFKRRKFLIKLHPDSYAYYKDTIEFLFENRNECKMFWKKCIEHHAFFRCSEMNRISKQQSKLFSRGSSFRYSGRTQKQLIDYIREHHRRREPFTRPIHSSFNRHYFNDRPLPTPLIPVVNQNGDGPLYMGSIEMDSNNKIIVDAHDEQDSPIRSDRESAANRSYRLRDDDSLDRPPTPEAPQLRRKAKGAVITFHFPVTEISPDSPSSDWTLTGGQAVKRAPLASSAAGVLDVTVIGSFSGGGEWDRSICPYDDGDTASPMLHNAVPASSCVQDDQNFVVSSSLGGAFEGANDLDDNVSEDSYHLSDHEETSVVVVKDVNNRIDYNNYDAPLSPVRDTNNISTTVGTTSPGRLDLSPPAPMPNYRFSPPPVSTLIKPVEIPSSSSAASVSSASSPPPRGLSGPLPGKVLPKVPIISAATKQKPQIPPKPKIRVQNDDVILPPSTTSSPISAAAAAAAAIDQPPIVVLSKSTVITKEISFNSSSNSVLSVAEPSVKLAAAAADVAPVIIPQPPPPPPPPQPHPLAVPMIEVDSEENPDVRHKFINGDIPYVLHVRRVNAADQQQAQQSQQYGVDNSSYQLSRQPGPALCSTFKQPSGSCTLPASITGDYDNLPAINRNSRASNRSNALTHLPNVPSGHKTRRKSLDLVPRKRLPSPANFSSQDHSVSPDSDHDVVTFVSAKWRSSGFPEKRSKRTDPRRMTQPVKLFTPLASSTIDKHGQSSALSTFNKDKKTVRSQPCLPINDDEESGDEFDMDSPSLHDSMEALEKMDVERISNSDLDDDDDDNGDERYGKANAPSAYQVHGSPFVTTTAVMLPYCPRPGSLEPPFIDDDSKSECHHSGGVTTTNNIVNNRQPPAANYSRDFDECEILLASAAERLKSVRPQCSTDV